MKAKSREIKFRVWGKANNEMIYSDENVLIIPPFFKSSDYSILFRKENGNDYVHGFSGNLMQYTERKDKNGKEIYEGDILESKTWGNIRARKPNHPYHVVEWLGCGWVASGYNGEIPVSPSLDVKEDFEVIGNIYENSELIK